MGFSFGELGVIAVVALLVIKPEDLPRLMRSFLRAKRLLTQTMNGAKSFIADIASLEEGKRCVEDLDQINFYLKKILSLAGEYKGEYRLDEVKRAYHKLMLVQASDQQEKLLSTIEEQPKDS